MTSTKLQIKREFDAFAVKVAKLESLRQQLDALDTHGLEPQVKLIRSKLHDVAAIPDIEKDIRALREQIQKHAHVPASRIAEHHKMLSVSQQLTHESMTMKKRIAELEQAIRRKREMSSREGLSKEELESVQDIPKLEGELHALRRVLDAHLTKQRHTVDAGVGKLVDTRFDEFLSEIKGELTERLKEKEMAMNKDVKHDLLEKEELLSHRYKELVGELHAAYKNKVHEELKKEVRKHFNEQLQERLVKERHKIVETLLEENARRLHAERSRLMHEFENQYKKKEQAYAQSLQQTFSRKRAGLQTSVAREMSTLRKQETALANKRRQLNALRARVARDAASKKTYLTARLQKMRALASAREKQLKHELRTLQLEREHALKKANSLVEVTVEKRSRLTKEEIAFRKKQRTLKAFTERKLQEIAAKAQRAQESSLEHERARAAEYKSLRDEEMKLVREKRLKLEKVKEDYIKLEAERNSIEKQLAEIQRGYNTELAKHEQEINQQFEAHVRENDELFRKKVEQLKANLHEALQKKRARLEEEHHAIIAAEVSKKEAEIRANLEHVYRERLKREVARREVALQQKKKMLEKHVMEHMKEVLG